MKIIDPKEQAKLTLQYLGFDSEGYVVETREGKKGIVLIVDNGPSVSPRYTAYKTLKIDLIKKLDEKRVNAFIKEIEKWFKISGYKYILPARHIVQQRKIPLIRMPYCEMDLRTYMERKGKLDQTEVIIFSLQILKGLIFANKHGIDSHQDLKPENILIENIKDQFLGFPPEGIHDSICYIVRITDFGMANAWTEVGMPQGSFPYMAPEQYIPDKYDNFKPDIFALGVMMIEMLTGYHPCGKKTKDVLNEWKSKEWESWATNAIKYFSLGELRISEKLKKIIIRMLSPNPSMRPSEENALTELLQILTDIDDRTAKQLTKMFDYFDVIADHDRYENRIHAVEQLSEILTQINALIVELNKEIAELKKKNKNQREIVYLCELCVLQAKILLQRHMANDRRRAEYCGYLLIGEIIKIRKNLSYIEVYPNFTFADFKLIKTPYPERDFELYAQIIGWGVDILHKTIGVKKTKIYFEKKDRITQSAYCIHIARKYSYTDPLRAVKILNSIIKNNPRGAFIYYLKARWLFQHYFFLDENDKDRDKISETISNCLDTAIEIDSEWLPPKILKRDIDAFR